MQDSTLPPDVLARRRWIAALGLLTLVRLVVAALVPLAPDEAYYWIWSRVPAAGYLDHPPMVALWIRAGTALAGPTALGVRLLGPLAAALASWMLFDAGRRLFNTQGAGLIAALLLNGTLLLGVGTVIMTPDSPLLFFWTASLWAVCRLLRGGGAGWWLLAGALGGLAMDSKYTALLLWIGVGLWLLWVPQIRGWLRRWQPWAACAIGLALFAPVLVWNAQHHWAGLIKQGGRVGDWRPGRAAGFLAELLGSQMGLATPLIFLLCLAGLLAACRHAWQHRAPEWSLLALLSLPPILVFVQHALGDRVQGNWPAIIYPALSLAAAALVAPAATAYALPGPRIWFLPAPLIHHWRAAAGLGYAVTLAVYVQAATGWFPVPPRLDPIALRLSGWRQLADATAALAAQTGAGYVVAEGYALGSELAWTLPPSLPVLGQDTHWTLTNLPAADPPGRPGLLLRDERDPAPPDPVFWPQAEQVGIVARPNVPGGAYRVYRIAGQRPALRLLPHP